MKTFLSPWALLVLLPVAPASQAATRSSANYQITTETFDGGGGASSGGVYQMNSSLGGIGEITSDASATTTVRSGFIGQLPSFVVGRQIFYNQSVWDGNDATANVSDDAAIAPNKTALLPGGLATFANYTSFSRGINGIMVDVTELSAAPTAADFVFRVGNNQTPAGWAAGPTPSVTVRYGAGVGGSDRITLIWPALAISKQWLQVTTLADLNTGLGASDIFYFGNAVGESGNITADAKVTSADALRVLNNITATAAITSANDHNRDGRVASADRLVVLNNLSSLQPLVLLDLRVGMSMSSGRGIAATQSVRSVPTRISWEEGALRLSLSLDAGAAKAGAGAGTVEVWSAESVDADEWELVDVAPTLNPATGELEFRLPVQSDQTQRFYRFEARSDR